MSRNEFNEEILNFDQVLVIANSLVTANSFIILKSIIWLFYLVVTQSFCSNDECH